MVTVIGSTDPSEVEELLWLGFRECDMGYDVGANCGQSIPQLMQFCRRVMAFEPNLDSFGEMRRRFQAGPIQLFNCAISDTEGTVQLAQLPGKQAETGQMVSPGTKGMEWDPGDWSQVETVSVPSRTLDSLLRLEDVAPGFVKVDVEGHEVQVLRGGSKVVTEVRPDWLIEFHSPGGYREIVDMLKGWDYKVETVRHPHYPNGSAMWHQHGWIRAFA